MAFSFNSVRSFKIIDAGQCDKNFTCDVYEKIKVNWKARKLGSKETGSSEKKFF